MGLFDRLMPWTRPIDVQMPRTAPSVDDIGVYEDNSRFQITQTYNDRNITYLGPLKDYDPQVVLRDKQAHIVDICKLSDYYVDADPIYRGIIKEVYTPFCIADDYILYGENEAIKQRYRDYYTRIHLRDKMESIFLQYFKYANVYVYLMPNGQIITLPVHLCRIGNVSYKGEPLVEFNCATVWQDVKQRYPEAAEIWLKDHKLEVRLTGYPPEVAQGIYDGLDWVQLNPNNVFVLQDAKEDWSRYAIPMVTSCLIALLKKEKISAYEDALLDLGMKGFLHVKYGDPKEEVQPNKQQLTAIGNIFKQATRISGIATTNNWADVKFIQPEVENMFEYDKYKSVNNDILSSGGISGILVTGQAGEGATFATAQVSMQTAVIRIRKAKESFCDMMNKINRRLNSNMSSVMPHASEKNVPKFAFPPVDLSGSKAFQEACFKLWKEGMVSDETLLQAYGVDLTSETEKKESERKSKLPLKMAPDSEIREAVTNPNESTETHSDETESGDGQRGHPVVDDTERHSDPGNAMNAKTPSSTYPDGKGHL